LRLRRIQQVMQALYQKTSWDRLARVGEQAPLLDEPPPRRSHPAAAFAFLGAAGSDVVVVQVQALVG
jgi:hypothetical protein